MYIFIYAFYLFFIFVKNFPTILFFIVWILNNTLLYNTYFDLICFILYSWHCCCYYCLILNRLMDYAVSYIINICIGGCVCVHTNMVGPTVHHYRGILNMMLYSSFLFDFAKFFVRSWEIGLKIPNTSCLRFR